MPYSKFTFEMLRALNINLPKGRGSNVHWNNYNIFRTEDSKLLRVQENQEENLFYDLLIEYVETKRYLDNNYERG